MTVTLVILRGLITLFLIGLLVRDVPLQSAVQKRCPHLIMRPL